MERYVVNANLTPLELYVPLKVVLMVHFMLGVFRQNKSK